MVEEKQADVIIIGGGLGGCLSALSVAKMGFTAIVTEETDWIGGQLTSQAVPPDEHPWIEEFGCTSSYADFRKRVREYYKQNYPLTDKAKANNLLNPGNGWVSRLTHEPRVALNILHDLLSPYMHSGKIQILYNYRPFSAETHKDYVDSITIKHNIAENEMKLKGEYFIDATECGDVLPLANVEYVIGAESKADTHELHAPIHKDPEDIQSITHVLAVDYIPNGDFTIQKPYQYEFWKQHIPSFLNKPLLSWYANKTNEVSNIEEYTFLPNDKDIPPLFTYRRIIDCNNFDQKIYEGDISLINWPQNDYSLGSVIDVTEEEKSKHLENAKQLSLSLLYWLQTEAPNSEGGTGYPGLRLKPNVLGTEDGLAKSPYIRESRRIKSIYTITEQDISKETRKTKGIKRYNDSVGVGSYHLDLHHTVKSKRAFYIPSYPYEIPLGSLLPIRVKNLLPGCKNIGTSQIANGCYRVHPTEWNIGESVGYLVSYAMLNEVDVHNVREEKGHLNSFQNLLIKKGIQMHWPEDIRI